MEEKKNGETKNGARMEKYSDLPAKAINAIVRTFQKRTAAGLQSCRDFVIPDKQKQATESSDFRTHSLAGDQGIKHS